jgi:hypothetical protein
MEECVAQDSSRPQRADRTLHQGVFHDVLERVEYLRSEIAKVAGPIEIVEVPSWKRVVQFISGEVPTDSQLATFHELPKQGELSKIADSADVLFLHLHPTPNHNG